LRLLVFGAREQIQEFAAAPVGLEISAFTFYKSVIPPGICIDENRKAPFCRRPEVQNIPVYHCKAAVGRKTEGR